MLRWSRFCLNSCGLLRFRWPETFGGGKCGRERRRYFQSHLLIQRKLDHFSSRDDEEFVFVIEDHA